MSASQLQRGLQCFGAAVAEEGAIQAAGLGQSQRQLRLPLMKIEVRNMNQLAALLRDGLFDGRMTIPQRIHADPAQQIQIALALGVDKMHTLAIDKQNRIALISRKQKLSLSRLDFIQSHDYSSPKS